MTFTPGTLTVTQEDASMLYTGDYLDATPRPRRARRRRSTSRRSSPRRRTAISATLGGKTVRFSIYKSTNISMTTPDYVLMGTINGTTRVASASVALVADTYTIKLELLPTTSTPRRSSTGSSRSSIPATA
jgi:hypothetical protein